MIIASAFDLSTNLPLIIGGIALGSIYGIVALGFVLVYKSTGVLNLAQGDFLMLGAYFSVTLLVTNDLGLLVSLPLVAVSMALVGLAIHFSVMRRLVGQPFFSIVLVTIGLGTIIRALLLMRYGPIEKGRLGALPEGSFSLGSTKILWANLIIVGIIGLLLVGFMLFFRFTRMGLHIRAVADNLEAAAAQGIKPDTVYAMTWGVSLALAGIAGLLFGNVNNVTPQASTIGLAAMPAAVLHFDRAGRQIQLVVHDQNFLGHNFVERCQRLHRAATGVHVRHRFQQPQVVAAHAQACCIAVKFLLRLQRYAFVRAQFIDPPKPRVVASLRILATGIA